MLDIKTCRWEDFYTGKFADPPYIPDGMTARELKRLVFYAYRSFYLRPRVLRRMAGDVASVTQCKHLVRRGLSLTSGLLGLKSHSLNLTGRQGRTRPPEPIHGGRRFQIPDDLDLSRILVFSDEIDRAIGAQRPPKIGIAGVGGNSWCGWTPYSRCRHSTRHWNAQEGTRSGWRPTPCWSGRSGIYSPDVAGDPDGCCRPPRGPRWLCFAKSSSSLVRRPPTA